jgi:hypothetical protein
MSEEKKIFKSAADILAIDDLPRKEVWVETWQTWVCMQGMTGAQRDAFEASIVERDGKSTKTNLQNLRARLVAACAVDPESGEPLFSQDQVRALGEKSAAALQTLFDVAKEFSGISDDDVDELEKNLESGQSDNSGSS